MGYGARGRNSGKILDTGQIVNLRVKLRTGSSGSSTGVACITGNEGFGSVRLRTLRWTSNELNLPMWALSLTPRFSGVSRRSGDPNRFSGFGCPVETAEAVHTCQHHRITPLKRGGNETGKRKGTAVRQCPRLKRARPVIKTHDNQFPVYEL